MAGRLDVLLMGPKPKKDKESDEEATETTSEDMACKAMWQAIKEDDYAGFKTAIKDFLSYREATPKLEEE